MRTITGNPIYEATRFANIRDLILDTCEKHAELDAFIFRRNPKLSEVHKTYYEFGEDILSLSAYIAESKYKGDKLSVVGENCYEWFVSYFSILGTDSVGVPLDRMLPEDEVVALLRRSESKILFYHHKHHDMMVSIANKIKNKEIDICVEKFICMFPDFLCEKGIFPEDDDMFLKFEDVISEGKKIRDAKGSDFIKEIKIDTEDPRIILFTSGTTSMSKGVLLTHTNICTDVYAITTTLYVKAGDRAFSILPLHHTFENTCDMFILSTGATLCLSDGLRYVTKNLQEWKPDVSISVPLLYENIHSKIEDGIKESGKEKLIKFMIPITNFLAKIGIDIRRAVYKEVLDKLGGNLRMVIIGGAGIDKRYVDSFCNFGIDFFQGYGLTESAPVISVNTVECNVHGSVGRPMTGITAAIDTEDERPGAVGEIITKSDCVMKGYYRNEEATREAIDENGWLHTGDMGFIDKKGTIHITGRVKSMIVLTSGKKAFPEEIESLITEIKGVNEAFVWGNKSDREQIDICAKLLIDREKLQEVLGTEGAPSDDEITAYLNDSMLEVNHKMPHYKYVKYFVFSEKDMIKTTTLKIKRPLEQAAIEDVLAAKKSSMKAVNGTNIDKMSV